MPHSSIHACGKLRNTSVLSRERGKKVKTSNFIFFFLLPFQDSRLTNSDLTLGPPWTWEDAQETLNVQPDGSALASLSATEMPSVEEEEEGSLSIEDEGFELLNSTYNKINGPGRPGLSRSSPWVAGSSGESIVMVSSISPAHCRDAWVSDGVLSAQDPPSKHTEQPRRSVPLTPRRRTSPRRS